MVQPQRWNILWRVEVNYVALLLVYTVQFTFILDSLLYLFGSVGNDDEFVRLVGVFVRSVSLPVLSFGESGWSFDLSVLSVGVSVWSFGLHFRSSVVSVLSVD